jgi:hypothetical protein
MRNAQQRLNQVRRSAGVVDKRYLTPAKRREIRDLAMVGFRVDMGIHDLHTLSSFRWLSHCWDHQLGQAYKPMMKF